MNLRIKEEELELVGVDGGGVEIFHYQGKPFTGTYLLYEKQGWLSIEAAYKNGYQEGWKRYYYENGQLEVEYKMQNNIMIEGTYNAFNEDGTPVN